MKAAKHIFRLELVDQAGVAMATDERDLTPGDTYRFGPVACELRTDDGTLLKVEDGEVRFTWVGIKR